MLSKYQIMGMPFGRVISVEQAIDATPGLGIVALDSDIYSETVERSKKSLALVSTCTCRLGADLLGKGCGRLRNTCSTMGLPAEGAIKAGMGRRVSKEEFLEAKLQATEAGLVHMTENVLDPMLVCSCCSCCCEILGILNRFESPATFTKSHFEAVIIPENCTGCKKCVDMCPMNAITMVKRPGTDGKKTPAKKKTATKKVEEEGRCKEESRQQERRPQRWRSSITSAASGAACASPSATNSRPSSSGNGRSSGPLPTTWPRPSPAGISNSRASKTTLSQS